MKPTFQRSVDLSLRLLGQLLVTAQEAHAETNATLHQALKGACVQRLALTVRLYICELAEYYKRTAHMPKGSAVDYAALLQAIADKPEAIELQNLLSQSSWLSALKRAEDQLMSPLAIDYRHSIFSVGEAETDWVSDEDRANEASENLIAAVSDSSENTQSMLDMLEDIALAVNTFKNLVTHHRDGHEEF